MPYALIGQQVPRLQLMPPDVLNAAQDAIDIYEQCGQSLDQWQATCLRTGCGLRADMTWAAFEVGIICQRQNGKGAVIEALLLASAFVWGNQITVYSAHRLETSRAIFRRLKALIEGNPDLARRVEPIADSADAIVLRSGQRIEFRTRTGSGGRGLTGDLVILDEALEVDADQLASLVPIMLARPYAQLWYFSTVPQYGDQHLCTVRARVLAEAERLAWAEWGCDRGVALDDPDALAQANPALGIRITLERLTDLRGILGDQKFATECMGIWPDATLGQVLNVQSWKRTMCDPLSRRRADSDLVLALDMTPMRDYGSIGMYGIRDDELEHLQLIDYRPGTDWMVPRAAELRATLNPVLWVVDKRNGAFALVDDLAKVGIKVAADPMKLKHGELLALEARDTADCVGQFIDGYRAHPPLYRHIGQEPLDLAVGNAKARPVGDGGQIAWARRVSTVDIGPLVTVSEARYGYRAWLTRQAKIPRSRIW